MEQTTRPGSPVLLAGGDSAEGDRPSAKTPQSLPLTLPPSHLPYLGPGPGVRGRVCPPPPPTPGPCQGLLWAGGITPHPGRALRLCAMKGSDSATSQSLAVLMFPLPYWRCLTAPSSSSQALGSALGGPAGTPEPESTPCPLPAAAFAPRGREITQASSPAHLHDFYSPGPSPRWGGKGTPPTPPPLLCG